MPSPVSSSDPWLKRITRTCSSDFKASEHAHLFIVVHHPGSGVEPRVHQARVEIRGSKSETEPHLLHGQARARGHSGVSPLPGTSRSVGVANGQFTSIYQHAHLPQASGMAIDHPVFTTPWPVIQRGTARSRTISWPFRQQESPWPQRQQGRSRPLPRLRCKCRRDLKSFCL